MERAVTIPFFKANSNETGSGWGEIWPPCSGRALLQLKRMKGKPAKESEKAKATQEFKAEDCLVLLHPSQKMIVF